MKNFLLTFILTLILVLGIFSTNVFGTDTSSEKRYELPYYGTYIKVSNVVKDNSNDYITTMDIKLDSGETRKLEIVKDLYIEATAPCKVTYGFGKQYIHYAKKMEDGSFESDYSKQINLDLKKYSFFTTDEKGNIIVGNTVDEVSNDSPRNAGAEGNYVTLSEGVYIVSNYDPSVGIGGGQSFEDYEVILTIKEKPLITAIPTSSKVLVNNEEKTFDAYTIDGNNYFKLRDLATVVNGTNKQFEVSWDGLKNAINLVPNKKYTTVSGEMQISASSKRQNAVLSTSKIYVDGKETALTAYTINNNNYFKLRDIAKMFDIGVTWDGATSTIGIDTSNSYTE